MLDPYAPFDGDGRNMALPTPGFNYPGTPMPFTKATARRLIDHFISKRSSYHSSMGATIWVQMAWCIAHGKAYKITTHYIGDRVQGYEMHLDNII